MSLRTKIILLFGVLAVVPMLALAAFSYWHAQNLLRTSVEGQLFETAQAVGEKLELATVDIGRALDTFAELLSQPDPDGADPRPPAPGENGHSELVARDSFLSRAAYVQIRDALGPIATLAGEAPRVKARCEEGKHSGILEFSRTIPLGGEVGTLTAGYWGSDLVSGVGLAGSRSLLVVDPTRGDLLFSDRCSGAGDKDVWGVDSELTRTMAGAQDLATFRFKEGGEVRLAAAWRSPEMGWTVVVTSPPVPLAGTLDRLVLAYWLFVLGLGISTALAFSVLLGRFTKSLRELARAAEEIGTGELDPWLPVPTSGEIGQLTLTLSRMLARIRHMMTQVDQSGRLAVVGQLSAYLAHEIRNPLSSIKLNLQRMRRWTLAGTVPEFCLEPLEISLKEVERLNASVSGVLQLSKAQDSPREVMGLHGLVEEAAELLATKFRRQGVRLRLDLDAGADRVLARSGQLKSVILNLMVNALEAQPSGGVLEIRTELARAPDTGDPVLALHFRDEGSGISPDIRDRIFEPFFTTKAGGSGIGLAMAFQAVRDNGGDLYLEPSISDTSGAEFVVVFPLAAVGPGATPDPVMGRPLSGLRALPPRWAVATRSGVAGLPERPEVPAHLMTPEGLEAVLALANSDSEEIN